MSDPGTVSYLSLVGPPRLAPPLIFAPRAGLPVLLSIPHSGRDYPDWLVGLARGGKPSLEPLEDPLVDRIAWRALAAGVGAVIAQAPRAAIDCNRSEEELDPAAIAGIDGPAVGPKAAGGLGLVPARTARDGALWRRPISRAELEGRLHDAHRPFHRAIAAGLDALMLRFGTALLLDCHSMPPRPNRGPQIIIGDRHRNSAAPWLSALAARIARESGFSVGLNDPFAGGHIVAAHGAPATQVHALQIEIDRSTYCQRDLRTPGPGFERVARLVETMALRLGEALSSSLAEAAE